MLEMPDAAGASCGATLPSVTELRGAKVNAWPKWMQRHVVLGLDLQGGSHILLEVDTNGDATADLQIQVLGSKVLQGDVLGLV